MDQPAEDVFAEVIKSGIEELVALDGLDVFTSILEGFTWNKVVDVARIWRYSNVLKGDAVSVIMDAIGLGITCLRK